MDFLEEKTSVVYNFTIKEKFKILKSEISRKNHQLSIDVLIIWFNVIVRKLQPLKNWLLSCKMGEWPISHDTYCMSSDSMPKIMFLF